MFLDLATPKAFELTSHINPFGKGVDGEDLSTDIAWLGAEKPSRIILNLSGTHGPEGFAGSAAQLAYLSGFAPSDLPDDTAICMVHAVNPFGFSYGHRCTENNVDLNRNWLDFNEELPENKDLERYLPLLISDRYGTNEESKLWEQLRRQIQDDGIAKAEDILSRGQYKHAKAPGYGGHAPEWSRTILDDLVTSPRFERTKVVLLDWHTGVPGIGQTIFLCYARPGDPMHERSEAIWGAKNIKAETVNTQWGHDRPSRHGLMYFGLRQLLAQSGSELAGGIVEFGTYSHEQREQVARATIYDHYMRFHGDRESQSGKTMLDAVRRAYYCYDNDDWKNAVVEKSSKIYDETLAGLRDW